MPQDLALLLKAPLAHGLSCSPYATHLRFAPFQNIVLAILEGVISGLEFLHQEGLAHGNLK